MNSSSDEKVLSDGECCLGEIVANTILASRQSAVEDLGISPRAWGQGAVEQLTAEGWSVVRTSELARKDQAIDEIRALQLALEQEAEADAEEIRADGGFPHYDDGWNAKTDAARRIQRILSDLSEHQEGNDG